MNRITSASLQSGILRYKNLTVGDVRPDATTKLYKRMFKGNGRKYIPVKDLTNDTMGRELSAYLINPEYIDKSVIDPDVVSRQLNPVPVVRTIQYSRLAYSQPAKGARKQTSRRAASLFGAALMIGQKAVTLAKTIVKQVVDKSTQKPFSRTYSVQKGMSSGINRRHASTGSVLVIAIVGIIGLQNMNSQQVDTPKPIATPVNSTIENPITSSGLTNTSQPIPIFNSATSSSTPQGPKYSIQPRNTGSSVVNNQPAIVPMALTSQAPSSSAIAETAPVISPVVTQPTADNPANPIDDTPTPIETIPEPLPIVESTVTESVNTVVDTTTQTLDGVTYVVGDLLGSN